jgi:hypothetical protein
MCIYSTIGMILNSGLQVLSSFLSHFFAITISWVHNFNSNQIEQP